MNKTIIFASLGLIVCVYIYDKLFTKKQIDIYKHSNASGGLSEQQAQIYANELYSAMNKYGTDTEYIMTLYDKIKDIPKAFNDISAKFGTMRYFMGINDDTLGTEKTLLSWLRSELSNDNYKRWESLSYE